MCTTTYLSCSSCCLILELRFLTTGRPVTVAARKLVAELGCRGMGLYTDYAGLVILAKQRQRFLRISCQ